MSKRVGKRRYPPGLKQQALDLLQVTGNVTAIAAQLGVHRTTVHYWLRSAAQASDYDSSLFITRRGPPERRSMCQP